LLLYFANAHSRWEKTSEKYQRLYPEISPEKDEFSLVWNIDEELSRYLIYPILAIFRIKEIKRKVNGTNACKAGIPPA
jgi:hypothetical protein